MPFESIEKYCKNCDLKLQLKCSRDIHRKNYCSHSCRAKHIKLHTFYPVNLLVKLMNTPEANAKKARKAELNGRWVSDRNSLNHRNRYENYQWKKLVMERDSFTCQECGKIGHKLHIHHKAPYKLFPKLRWELYNGITVCQDCHKKIHSAFTELFNSISSQKISTYATL